MQGQLTRVSGTFSNTNLPKLSDFKTASLLDAILSHPNCTHFYDLTDSSKLQMTDGKVTSVPCLKGGNALTAFTEQGPTYDQNLFGGRGGLIFAGGQRMTASGVFQSNIDTSINASIQPTSAGANSLVFMPTAGNAGGNLYYNGNVFKAFSGGLTTTVPSIYKRACVTVDYRVDRLFRMSINTDTIKMTNAGSAAHSILDTSILNVGATSTNTLFANMYLGHIAVFNKSVTDDSYLFALLNEYHRRQYNL